MELIQPGIGLIFWMTISFGILLFILGKFAWPVITKALKDREASIADALKAAEKARQEMEALQADNEKLVQQAREERDAILAEARKLKDKIVDEAKDKAKEEATRIAESALESIENEKRAAIVDLKNQVAGLSLEIAERILKEELKDKKKHEELISRLVNEVKFN